ncbi:type II toxin-antitoxin system death-on-curing family toxin [Helicobacter sp. 23-1046]
MNYLSLEDAIALHDKMIEVMGGLQGFESSRVGYLESALEHIKNDDFYPNFLDKLTHLVFCCVKFHPFLDGNKRSAILIARVFVLINAPEILPNDFYERLENVVVGVANDEINKDSLKAILAEVLSL